MPARPAAARRGACGRPRRPAPTPARPPRGRAGRSSRADAGSRSRRSASGSASNSCTAGARAISASPAAADGAPPGAQHVRCDRVRRRRSVDHVAALRLVLGDGEEALPQPLVIIHVTLLEGVGVLARDGARQPPRGGAPEADVDRHVEYESQVRIGELDDDQLERLEHVERQARRLPPDTRGWNRKSGPRSPSARPPAPGGSPSRCDRRARRRTAAPPTAPNAERSRGSRIRRRTCSANGDPPGSRVRMPSIPLARRWSANSCACVDLPEPSPPSNVMNRAVGITRAGPACHGAAARCSIATGATVSTG